MLCSAVTIVQQMEKAHNHLGQAKWIFLREPPTRRYAKAIDWPYKLREPFKNYLADFAR